MPHCRIAPQYRSTASASAQPPGGRFPPMRWGPVGAPRWVALNTSLAGESGPARATRQPRVVWGDGRGAAGIRPRYRLRAQRLFDYGRPWGADRVRLNDVMRSTSSTRFRRSARAARPFRASAHSLRASACSRSGELHEPGSCRDRHVVRSSPSGGLSAWHGQRYEWCPACCAPLSSFGLLGCAFVPRVTWTKRRRAFHP